MQYYGEPRVILRGIKDHLFKSSDDLGATHIDKFNTLPIPLIAAGLTVVSIMPHSSLRIR